MMPRKKSAFAAAASLLRKLKVAYRVEEFWQEKPSSKVNESKPLPAFRQIQLPLTREEWCAIAMRDGDAYIGGCCGRTGYAQDHVNAAFRDSGWIDLDDFAAMAELLTGHDQFTKLPNFKKALPDEALCAKWPKLRPWSKIAAVWHIVKPFHIQPLPKPFRDDLSLLDRSISTLAKTFNVLGLRHILERSPGDADDRMRRQAEHAMDVYQVLPALKVFNERIGELNPGPLACYAICHAGKDEVAKTNLGLAVYENKERAETMLAGQRAQDDNRRAQNAKAQHVDDLFVIRRVRISVETGIEFLPDVA